MGAAASLLADLVPAKAVAAETRVDEAEAELFPAEEALLARAVPKRRREFTAGRVCARRAMARLGVAPAPLLAGPNREPLWPAGLVGSITHCEGYRAAAVARAGDVLSIGIDAEPNGPTPDGVLDRIALPAEISWVRAAARVEPEVHWDRLLFCAKESVYKTWFPLAGSWLGFEDALITLDDRPDDSGPTGDAGRTAGATRWTGAFTAKLLVTGPILPDGRRLSSLRGRYLVTQGLILAVVAINPDDRVDGDSA
ncbi:4'-phosphopantetheinyl transferase superfamily protein [Frankia sp. AgB1.8]|nr:4'-phosphopantetheinyl transferase superfamily protein [Frankia sp. AgB1.8]